MPHLYPDKRKNPPVWRFQIWDANGKRKSFTGTTSKRETMEMAVRRQAYEKELAGGTREEKKTKTLRPFIDLKMNYLLWGRTQGGRNGKPWGKTTARMRQTHLDWWSEKLNLKAIEDLNNCLPRVEQELQKLKDTGKVAGKTLFHYASALRAFISWCEDRDYLEKDPLRKLGKFDVTPQFERRAMTLEEIKVLLEKCALHRRILYEVAFCTGLRAGELRSLTKHDLDVKNGGLKLCSGWTKNRKRGFQPLPRGLINRLEEFTEIGLAKMLYQRHTRKSDNPPPSNPLLYVPSHPARDLDKDLLKAGIPKETPEGKVDFHACRTAYISHLVEGGADVKVVQTLARHSDPRITLAIYAKVRPERLTSAVEEFGKLMSL